MAKIDHAAVRTTAYEDAQKFFEDVFKMHIFSCSLFIMNSV